MCAFVQKMHPWYFWEQKTPCHSPPLTWNGQSVLECLFPAMMEGPFVHQTAIKMTSSTSQLFFDIGQQAPKVAGV